MYSFETIIKDTLKKKDKESNYIWSRTSLTMFTAWVIAIGMALFNQIKNGFNFEVFCVFVTVALGSKVTDAISQKLINKKE
jgi:hypothetical protein